MKLHTIQALRAVAALLVLVYHTRAIEMDAIARKGLNEAPMLSTFVQNGFSGVDFFFVISGFIMVYVTGKVQPRLATAGAFLFARAARIYPLWWLFAAIMTAYFFLAYGGVPFGAETLEDGSRMMRENSALHLIYSYALLPQLTVPIHGVGWTLVHEMHFYIGFALLILLPRRFLPLGLAGWAAIILLGTLTGLQQPTATDYISLLLHPLSLEFLGGCAAALLICSGRRFKPMTVLVVGLIAFVAALYLQPYPTDFTLGWGRVLFFGIPSILIVYGAAALEAEDRVRVPRSFVVLGDWSYALYLGHTLVLSGLRRIFDALAARLQGTFLEDVFTIGAPGILDNLLFYIVGAVGSIVFAGLVFRLFEKPAMTLTGRLRRDLFEDTNAQLKPAPIKAAIW
ncbi:acyltransferase family protein [Henriciella marina]|uniref:Acyltransferase n=1 Tax=Henriciella marina TaxID=453851 RepID=A0ABT4LY43_9PROT|nr:acyltransferase [Henriciella marina]MCZ4298428.1 acyltransferase [Henriciella marina]